VVAVAALDLYLRMLLGAAEPACLEAIETSSNVPTAAIGDTVSQAPFSPDPAIGDTALLLALDAAGRLAHELASVGGVLDALAATVRHLRQHMLDSAAPGSMLREDISERALRARVNIVMRGIRVLESREHEVPSAALAAPFRSVRDVCVCLEDRVTQIYARWARQQEPERDADPDAQRWLRYLAVDDAEVAFALLGREPAIARFLSAGAGAVCGDVGAACREIAAAIGLSAGASTTQRGRSS
jgi:hypothetical protein